jgi:hypothetical protein
VALTDVLLVTDLDTHRGHREMIGALLTALADLGRGLQPELLRKRKVANRPRQSMQVGHIRAVAARFAELLEATGVAADEATEKIAGLLRRHGFEVGRTRNPRPDRTVVARWRADVAAGRVPREGKLAYENLTALVCGVPALEPAEARRHLLRAFEEHLRAQNPGGKSAVGQFSE